MSAVDVLAVMDDAVEIQGGLSPDHPTRQARDAVAELIAAAELVADNVILCGTTEGRAIVAALARCGGAK